MDIIEIMSILPHRYPLLLIDRIVEMERKTRIVAIKNVTINEPHFAGHFPGSPSCPASSSLRPSPRPAARSCSPSSPSTTATPSSWSSPASTTPSFRRPVVPGDQLRIEVTVLNWRPTAVKLHGAATVDGKLACEATIMCATHLAHRRNPPCARTRTNLPEPQPSEHAANIHPTAIVAAGAQIPASCTIGPYCTIGPKVVLGEECNLISHVVIDGHTTIGAAIPSIPSPAIGVAPQDLKYSRRAHTRHHRRRQHYPRVCHHQSRH